MASERLPDLAIREGDWKLLCEYDGTQPQLYNVATDRGETANLAAQHPGLADRLIKTLLAWHQSMPPDNGPALAESGQNQNRKKRR